MYSFSYTSLELRDTVCDKMCLLGVGFATQCVFLECIFFAIVGVCWRLSQQIVSVPLYYVLQRIWGSHLCQPCCVACTTCMYSRLIELSCLVCSSEGRALLKCRASWVQFPPGAALSLWTKYFLGGVDLFDIHYLPCVATHTHSHISKPWVLIDSQSVCVCMDESGIKRTGYGLCVFGNWITKNCSCDHHKKCSIPPVFVTHVYV